MKETQLPNPSTKEVSLWLKYLSRQDLHDQGWLEVNRRFHGVAFGLRPFINEHYSDPKEQEAAFDGATLALLSMAHFDDIDRLAKLFDTEDNTEEQRTIRLKNYKR